MSKPHTRRARRRPLQPLTAAERAGDGAAPDEQGGGWLVLGARPGGERVVLATAPSEGRAGRAAATLELGGIEGYIRLEVQSMNDHENGLARRHTLNLREAEQRVPAVSAVEAMRRQLSLAIFGAIGESEVGAIVTKLKEKALGGDLRAMRLLFSLILPQQGGGRPVQVQQIAVTPAAGQRRADLEG